MLAHHFTQAGVTEAAIEWWGKAGQQSLERSALVEAVTQLRKGLALSIGSIKKSNSAARMPAALRQLLGLDEHLALR